MRTSRYGVIGMLLAVPLTFLIATQSAPSEDQPSRDALVLERAALFVEPSVTLERRLSEERGEPPAPRRGAGGPDDRDASGRDCDDDDDDDVDVIRPCPEDVDDGDDDGDDDDDDERDDGEADGEDD